MTVKELKEVLDLYDEESKVDIIKNDDDSLDLVVIL